MAQVRSQSQSKAEQYILLGYVLQTYKRLHETVAAGHPANLAYSGVDGLDLDVVHAFFIENPDLIPFNIDLRIKVDGSPGERTLPLIGRGILDRDINATIATFREKFPNSEVENLQEFAYFKKVVAAKQLKECLAGEYWEHLNPENAFDAALTELYDSLGKRIGNTVITPEMMDDPVMIAYLETSKLHAVMGSRLSNDDKLEAINQYQLRCAESWPSWLLRLTTAVVFTATAAIGLGVAGFFAGGLVGAGIGIAAGVTAGTFAADKLCKATFFARQAAVDSVAMAAIDQLLENNIEPKEDALTHSVALANR